MFGKNNENQANFFIYIMTLVIGGHHMLIMRTADMIPGNINLQKVKYI